MIARGQIIKDTRICLDGASFYECRFQRCRLIFSGLLPVTLEGCTFDNCSWEFSGPAQNTLSFMTMLYTQGAKDLIESTFAHIKGAKADPEGKKH